MTEDALFAEKRPHFGRKQVRTLKGLKVGRRYFECCNVRGLSKILIKITGKPYKDDKGSWWVLCQRSHNDGKNWSDNQIVSLEDMNVVPYTHNKMWNSSNWFERP